MNLLDGKPYWFQPYVPPRALRTLHITQCLRLCQSSEHGVVWSREMRVAG